MRRTSASTVEVAGPFLLPPHPAPWSPRRAAPEKGSPRISWIDSIYVGRDAPRLQGVIWWPYRRTVDDGPAPCPDVRCAWQTIRVVDARTKLPIAGAEVLSVQTSREFASSTITDAEGTARIAIPVRGYGKRPVPEGVAITVYKKGRRLFP